MANLTVNGRLDRELVPLYRVVVRATDMGSPARSSDMVSICNHHYGCLIVN